MVALDEALTGFKVLFRSQYQSKATSDAGVTAGALLVVIGSSTSVIAAYEVHHRGHLVEDIRSMRHGLALKPSPLLNTNARLPLIVIKEVLMRRSPPVFREQHFCYQGL